MTMMQLEKTNRLTGDVELVDGTQAEIKQIAADSRLSVAQVRGCLRDGLGVCVWGNQNVASFHFRQVAKVGKGVPA